MLSTHNNAKTSKGLGGFLQQAVLSVESKLDNILADESQPSPNTNSVRRVGDFPQPGILFQPIPLCHGD